MPNFDEIKGRTKEAAGTISDDEELEREGKIDQATGSVKEAVGDVSDKVKNFVNRD